MFLLLKTLKLLMNLSLKKRFNAIFHYWT